MYIQVKKKYTQYCVYLIVMGKLNRHSGLTQEPKKETYDSS